MKNLNQFLKSDWPKIQFVLTDIDDTLTNQGQLFQNAYSSLWDLQKAGYKIIPITGRPAGWCEMIARFWPVEGVVGENGGFYFRYDHNSKKMKRWYAFDENEIKLNSEKLKLIEKQTLTEVPGCAISSDQFCRQMDLAIDFSEDIPALDQTQIQKIVDIFHQHGAQAKVSSIHVNGWFGNYNKISTTLEFLKNEFQLSEKKALEQCLFIGDSPNDEPMFEKFPLTFGVANINKFSSSLKHLPAFVANKNGGDGFAEIAEWLLK